MKILVTVKQVVQLDEDFEFGADGRSVDPDFFLHDLNEWDDYSLEEAVLLKEANPGNVEVVVVTIGDENAEEGLRKCLAKGADRAVRIWDSSLEGSDPIAIARILAAFARKETPDLVFAGVQSSDFAYGATAMALAGILDWPHAAVISKFSLDGNTARIHRELEGGIEEAHEIALPAVLSLQLGINKPRYASLRGIKQAASLPVEELTPGDLGLSASEVGEAGSASRVRRMYIPEKASSAELIGGSPADQAARIIEIIKQFKGA